MFLMSFVRTDTGFWKTEHWEVDKHIIGFSQFLGFVIENKGEKQQLEKWE